MCTSLVKNRWGSLSIFKRIGIFKTHLYWFVNKWCLKTSRKCFRYIKFSCMFMYQVLTKSQRRAKYFFDKAGHIKFSEWWITKNYAPLASWYNKSHPGSSPQTFEIPNNNFHVKLFTDIILLQKYRFLDTY